MCNTVVEPFSKIIVFRDDVLADMVATSAGRLSTESRAPGTLR